MNTVIKYVLIIKIHDNVKKKCEKKSLYVLCLNRNMMNQYLNAYKILK